MSSVKRTYSTIMSRFRHNNGSIEKASKSNDESSIPQHQLAAQRKIDKSPSSAKGYLALGEIYQQEGYPQAALAIYKQGLDHVPSNDAYQLHKKILRVSVNLTNIQQIQQLIPHDVWTLIFQHLDARDLLRCTGVSRIWCNFIVLLPELWRQLPVQIPQMTGSVLDPQAPTKKLQELILSDNFDHTLIHDTLMFLTYWDSSSLQKLSFHRISTWPDTNVDLLAQVLRSLNPSVRVEFLDCMIPSDKVISPILESCAKLAYVSFSQLNLPTINSSASPLCQVIIPNIELLSLTYLKLSFEYATYASDGPIKDGLLCGIFCKCPNLTHMFLDSNGALHQRECISQALQHCSRLVNLVMNNRAMMPRSVMSGIKDHELHPLNYNLDTTPANTAKIQKLVLGGGKIDLDQDDIGTAFSNHHKSLEYLYVNVGRVVSPGALSILANHGAPNLREICVVANLYYRGSSAIVGPSIQNVFPALFSRCPNLEVIVLYDAHGVGFHKSVDGRIKGDSKVMKAIAEHCPQLRHLRIVGGWYRQTLDSLLHFATKRGSRLIYLETDMVRKNILETVKKLPLLQYLHVRKETQLEGDFISKEDKLVVEQILSDERNGQLTLDN